MPTNTLTIQSKNRLAQGEMISQEITSTTEGFRRWIAIYPLVDERLKKKHEGFKFKVIDFELDIHLMDEFFGEEDKKKLKEYLIASDVELVKLLNEVEVDLQRFDAPWKNNYPL
jgi:hypothetical protein